MQDRIPSADATPPPLTKIEQPAAGEIRILARGAQSNIHDSFVAVVRDAETYAALRKLDGMMPDLKADFFEMNAVVAAFLGERRTGGYGIEITGSADAIHVVEKKPGKDAMLTQMITSPFKIVAVAGGAKSPLSLTVDEAWQQRLSSLNISSGQFTNSGGIAGSSHEFRLEGGLRMMVEGRRLATFLFSVRGSDPARKRALTESATGTITTEGQVTISRMSAGSLVDRPNDGLKATGQLSGSNSKVVLNLVSLPSMISDGYGGMGTLTAETTNARPGSQ